MRRYDNPRSVQQSITEPASRLPGLFVALALLLNVAPLLAQCEGDVVLTTNAEIAAFAAATAGCDVYTGDVTVRRADSLSLAGITGIRRLTGTLRLETALEGQPLRVEGWTNLEYASEFHISGGATDVQGFPALARVGTYHASGPIPASVASVRKLSVRGRRGHHLLHTIPLGLRVEHWVELAYFEAPDLDFLSAVSTDEVNVVHLVNAVISGSTSALRLPDSLQSLSLVWGSSSSDLEMMRGVRHIDWIDVVDFDTPDWGGMNQLRGCDQLILNYAGYGSTGVGIRPTLDSMRNLGTFNVAGGEIAPDLKFAPLITRPERAWIFSELSSLQSLDGIQDKDWGDTYLEIESRSAAPTFEAAWLCSVVDRPRYNSLTDIELPAIGFDIRAFEGNCAELSDNVTVVELYSDVGCDGRFDRGRDPLVAEGRVSVTYGANPASRSVLTADQPRAYVFRTGADSVSIRPPQRWLADVYPGTVLLAGPTWNTDTVRFRYCEAPPFDSAIVREAATRRGAKLVGGRVSLRYPTIETFANQAGLHQLSQSYSTPQGNPPVAAWFGTGMDSVASITFDAPRESRRFTAYASPVEAAPGAAHGSAERCHRLSIERQGAIAYEAQGCTQEVVYNFDAPNQLRVDTDASQPERIHFTAVADNLNAGHARSVTVIDTLDALLDPTTVRVLDMDPSFTFSQSGNLLTWEASSLSQPPYGDTVARAAGLVISYTVERLPQRSSGAAATEITNTLTIIVDDSTYTSNTVTVEGTSTLAEAREPLFEMYPNPAVDAVTIVVDEASLPQPYRVYDGLGRTLSSGMLHRATQRLPLDVHQRTDYVFVKVGTSARRLLVAAE